jgi:hypothetical protein
MTACDEPPTTIIRDGAICVKNGCSYDVQCNPTSTSVSNPSGTKIHFEGGCASVNGDPVCDWAGSKYPSVYTIKSTDPYATTTIYSNFGDLDFRAGTVQAGCKLNARWPADYGDVVFRVTDGCIYDAGGNKIWENCCRTRTSDQMSNPYVKKAATMWFADNLLWKHYAIVSNGWITDGGKSLHDEVNGCTPTSVTSWSFYEAEQGGTSIDGSEAKLGKFPPQYVVEFDIDLFVKDGCDGRAIASAGGPSGMTYREAKGVSFPWNLWDL